jgi:hypothetical protein
MCSAACRRVAARRHQRNYMARLIESRNQLSTLQAA